MNDDVSHIEKEQSMNDESAQKKENSEKSLGRLPKEKLEDDSISAIGIKNKKIELKPDSLKQFIEFIYKGQKLNKSYKDLFATIKANDYVLRQNDKDDLLALSRGKDKDYRATLSLAEFLLEKRHIPLVRDNISNYLEYVVSHAGNLSKQGKSSILREWLDGYGGKQKILLVEKKIEAIKDGMNTNGTPRLLSERAKNNLIAISAVWLFVNNEETLHGLMTQLTGTVFSLQGESNSDSKSLMFLLNMISSTSKPLFSQFIHFTDDLSNKNRVENASLQHRITLSDTKINKQQLELVAVQKQKLDCEHENEQLSAKNKLLNEQVEEISTKASHQGIHKEDENRQVKVKLIRELEESVLEMLMDAKVANSRAPSNTEIVTIRLEEAIDQIKGHIEWLKK